MPKVGVFDDPAPTASAASLSPKNAIIGVTTGALVGSIASLASMLLVLGWAMLRSVITEFKFGLGLITGMLGLIMLALGAAFALVAFVPGPLISSAVSRHREFLADASGVELTRSTDGLARVLEKIEAHPAKLSTASFEVRGLFFVNSYGDG